MTCEIKQSDVIRLILQFLKETNLLSSYKTLQEESHISLNLLEDPSILSRDIKQGRWDQVLRTIKAFHITPYKLISLYEQILYELMELSEWVLALDFFKEMIEKTPLSQEFPEKTLYLSSLIRRGVFNYKEIYLTSSKEKQRVEISASILEEVVSVPPFRLLTLLAQALKHQEVTGELKPNVSLDIFTNKVPELEETHLKLPTTISKKLIFPSGSRINVLEFSPNGQYLILGAADGLIELWDPIEGKLRKDLAFQQEEAFMLHEAGITGLAVSKDSELLASGDQIGGLKVWRLATGKCLRKLPKEEKMIGFLGFGKEVSQLLVGSEDLKVYGLKSGRVLKEFRGEGFVLDVIIKEDRVLMGGKDGVLRIFDWGSCECIMSFRVSKEGYDREISNILEIPSGELIVCNRSSLIVMSGLGVIVKRFDLEDKDIVCGCLSLKTEEKNGFIYAIGSKNVLYCVNYHSGKIESSLKFGEKGEIDIIGIKHHPKRNLLVLWSLNGIILYLSPE